MLATRGITCQWGYMVAAELPEDRDGFRFRGGSNVIDLPATLQARLSATPRELLATPEDLGRWLISAGMAQTGLKPSAKDLAAARLLREAIYLLAGARRGAKAEAARETMNRIAAGAAAVPQLGNDGTVHLEGSANALLVTLARDAVRLFGSGAVKRLRKCQSPACTLYFIDTSRRGDRRWCSMSACGNKAKVDEFRRRQRAGDT